MWHTWAAVSIYEKQTNGEEYERLYMKIRHPKLKSPSGLGITNVAHISHFVNSAFRGYTKDLNEKFGFDFALEWYIEGQQASVAESKFLGATTCLELLLDRYSAQSGTEFVLPEEKFASLTQYLTGKIGEWAAEHGIDESTTNALKSKLRELNRRSYARKAKLMLEFWKIKTDDLRITIRDIITIRDEITHTGGIRSEACKEKLIPAYLTLMEILVRVFLVMLRYDGQYFSLAKKDWVNFSDVRQ